MEYKVGDEVLIKVTLTKSDEWYFKPEQIVALVNRPEPDLTFKVGDWVIHNDWTKLGTGRVAVDDSSSIPFQVEWDNGEYHWARPGDLKPAEKPQPKLKYNVGDKVIHINKPEWGVGTVESVDPDWDSEVDYYERNSEYREVDSCPYKVRFPRYEGRSWRTAERNLTPAE